MLTVKLHRMCSKDFPSIEVKRVKPKVEGSNAMCSRYFCVTVIFIYLINNCQTKEQALHVEENLLCFLLADHCHGYSET